MKLKKNCFYKFTYNIKEEASGYNLSTDKSMGMHLPNPFIMK